MKRFFLLLLCLLLLLSLSACKRKAYTNEPTASMLAEQALESLDNADGYTVAEHDLLEGYFHRPEGVSDFTVRIRTDRNNIDEFGIYRVSDGKVREMASLLEGYLSRSLEQNRDWYDSYIPAETPKLRRAEVRVFGDYAVYAILSDGDRERLFERIEAILTA